MSSARHQVEGHKRPAEAKLLGTIKEMGRASSAELSERSGIKQNNIPERLERALARGVIRCDVDRSGFGRPKTVYSWIGEESDSHQRAALDPRQPGKRKCLCCGNPFASLSAENRICPKCKPSQITPAGVFETSHVRHY
jgi:hypothetical protein